MYSDIMKALETKL